MRAYELGSFGGEAEQTVNAPCKGCERRTVHPNCHAGCEEYKVFSQKRRNLSKKRLELSRTTDHCCEKYKRLLKRMNRR